METKLTESMHCPDALCEWSLDGSPIKCLSESLKSLVPGVGLVTHEGGIYLRKRNGGGTVYVCVQLHAENIDQFYCKATTMIGMNWNILNMKVFKSMSGKQSNMTYFVQDTDRDVSETFSIMINNDSGRTNLYSIFPTDDESDDMVIQDDYEYTCIMHTNTFQSIIKDIGVMVDGKASGSRVKITGLQDSIKFAITGIDGNLQILLSPKTDNDLEIHCEKDDFRVFENEYPIEILSEVCKSANIKMTENVQISLPIKGPDSPPLLIQMNVGSYGEVKYYISEKACAEELACVDDQE